MNFKEYLEYNSETGLITWIKSSAKKIKIGQIAGSLNDKGYIKIILNRKNYQAHRLAWYLYYGSWPTNQIDHINGIKTDNKISNLRDVTNKQNNLNKKGHREKTYKYYAFNKYSRKWTVQKQINGKQKYFGYFDTELEAKLFIQENPQIFK